MPKYRGHDKVRIKMELSVPNHKPTQYSKIFFSFFHKKIEGGSWGIVNFGIFKNILFVLTVSDWPIIMIAPGGLLLVVPHVFAVPVSVLWVGLQKST